LGCYFEKVTTKMVAKKRTKKRVKKSGLIYFATNTRLADMVKIGMTVNTAEERLNTANRKHEFMAGRWSINQKVKTNDVKRTEELAHQLFKDFHDTESVSTEMFFVPKEYTIKKMADLVREKDKVLIDRADKTEAAKAAIEAAKRELDEITQETDELLSLPRDILSDD